MDMQGNASGLNGHLLDGRLAIVTPVYNEGDTVESTVNEIQEKILNHLEDAELLIFEDGSTDRTRDVLLGLSRLRPNVIVHTSQARKGYLRAVKEALLSVDERRYAYLLFLDSDGQYDPDDFYELARVMKDERPDFVQGRRSRRTEPLYRVILSVGLRYLVRTMFGSKCEDVTTGLRLMKTASAKNLARRVKYSKYHFWLEFTSRAAEEGMTIREVGISFRKRRGGRSSFGFAMVTRAIFTEFWALLQTWLEYRRRDSSGLDGQGGQLP